MTYLERAKLDGLSEREAMDLFCPDYFGYEPVRDLRESMEFCNRSCQSCWNREMSEPPERVCSGSCSHAVDYTTNERGAELVQCEFESDDIRIIAGGKCYHADWFERHQNEGETEPDRKLHQQNDPVNHPSHYNKGGVECIDCIESAVSGLTGLEAVLTGNVIKYIYRWNDKGGLQDLEKCRWYLNRLIDRIGKNQSV